jgi:hypothetical protein
MEGRANDRNVGNIVRGAVMRFKRRRDANEPEIFKALEWAGCDPMRLTDVDIAARHADGYGVLIEVKTAKGAIRDIQVRLQNLFMDRYHICRTPEAALAACGIQVAK